MSRALIFLMAVYLSGSMTLAQTTHKSQEGVSANAQGSASSSQELSGGSTIDESLLPMQSEAYCDIIAVNRGLGWAATVNYSTFKVGSCSTEQISSLTAASARAQMATIDNYDHLIVTGPYYATMDVNNAQVFNPYISLGNLRFTEVSRSEFTVFDALADPEEAWRWMQGLVAYNPVRTTGEVNFIWFAGTKGYIIVTDEGQAFIMTGVNHNIAYGEHGVRLKNLGNYLNLPEGWRFETKTMPRVLSLNSHILANKEFDRLIDEFGNLYIDLPSYVHLFK